VVIDDLDALDDAALLAASQRRDEAFAVFYRRYVDDVLRLCARHGLAAVDAADVTAETFAAALLARARYRPELGPARSWLLGIASHKLADYGRRRARDRRALRRLAVEPIALSQSDYVDYAELVAEERGLAASDALSDLADGQRAAVYARVVKGESYEAIARGMRITEDSARKRVSRGLAALRVRLEKDQP
jgi:RNA polymerase sigma factor (sigma-70 family)